MTAKTPEERAYEAYWESITDGGEPPGQFDELDLDEITAWKASATAVLGFDIDVYRLSMIRALDEARDEGRQQLAAANAELVQLHDANSGLGEALTSARAERDQASVSYQQATAELESVAADRDRTRADLAAMTVDRDRYRNAVRAADGPESNDSGRNLPSAPDDTDDTPEAAAGLSEPQACRGFRWIGQSFATCDGCGKPAWEHDGMLKRREGALLIGGVDDDWYVEPWKPGEADAIKQKWGNAS